MSEVLNTLLKDTYTLKALKHKIGVLKSTLSQNFFGAQGQQTQLEAKDLVWLKSLSPAFLQNFNKDNIYDLLSQLEREINTLKVLTIYLTFEPDDETLALIGTYVRKTFSSIGRSSPKDYHPLDESSGRSLPLLLDIKYDPNLIAGAALVWNGIRKDYSLRSTIEQKKALVLDSFKKYLR